MSANAVVSFDVETETFTNYGAAVLSMNARAWAQSFAQIGESLYYMDDVGENLFRFDLSTGSVDSSFSVALARSDYYLSYACVAATNSSIYVVGGYASGYLNKMYILSLSTETWSTGLNLKTARYGHACAVDESGQLFAVGGYNGASLYLNSVEVLDLNTLVSWQLLDDTLERGITHSRLIRDGVNLLTVGGTCGSSCYTTTMNIINTLSRSITVSDGSLDIALDYMAAVVAGDTAYAFGGSNPGRKSSWRSLQISNSFDNWLCVQSSWIFQGGLQWSDTCVANSVSESTSILNGKQWTPSSNGTRADYMFTVSDIDVHGDGEAGVAIYPFETASSFYFVGLEVDRNATAKLVVRRHLSGDTQHMAESPNTFTYEYGTFYTLLFEFELEPAAWNISLNGLVVSFSVADDATAALFKNGLHFGMRNVNCNVTSKSLIVESLAYTEKYLTWSPTSSPTSPSIEPTPSPTEMPSYSLYNADWGCVDFCGEYECMLHCTIFRAPCTCLMCLYADELILRHKDVREGYFSVSLSTSGLENEQDPDSNTFSVVGSLNTDYLRQPDGKWQFKLVNINNFGETVDEMIWRQSSWLTEGVIEGFQEVHLPPQGM